MFVTISLLLAVACLLPATAKMLSHPKMRHSAAHFGIPWRRYRLIGVAELAAAAGILLGLWWQPPGVAAAAGMALLLAGALVTHRRAADGGSRRREGDGASPDRPRPQPRLPGYRPHQLSRR